MSQHINYFCTDITPITDTNLHNMTSPNIFIFCLHKGPPYAQLTSDPSESSIGQVVYFDASKSHDFKEEPCEHFVFDFGDGSKLLHAKKEVYIL